MKKLILLILGILLFIPFASAYNVDIKWDSDLDGYNQRVYHCTDALCSAVDSLVLETSTQTDKTGTFFTAQGTQSYAVYFYKQGYVPKGIILTTWGDLTASKRLAWSRKSDVSAQIKSVVLSSEPKAGEPLTFKVDVESAFHSSEGAQGTPSYIPPDLMDDYYSSLISVKFSVFNEGDSTIVSYEAGVNIPVDSHETIAYTITPKTAGKAVATVTTQVIDDQVASYKEQTIQTDFTISGSADNPPNALIDSPADNQEFIIGLDALALNGHGEDDGRITAYSWTLTHESGAVITYDTQTVTNLFLQLAGTWTVTFNVRDNAFQWDPTPAQLKITLKSQGQHDPEIKINSPSENEKIKDTYRIKWTADDKDQDSGTLHIELKHRKLSNSFSELVNSILKKLGLQDGDNWKSIVLLESNPGYFDWDTSGMQNGGYELQAAAIDDTDRNSYDIVSFHIDNKASLNPFAIIRYSLRETLEVRFDASDSYDTDGNIVSYEWDFGDGITAVGSRIDHIYASSKSYIVTLTVTDNDGLQSTKQVEVIPMGSAVTPSKAEHKFSITNIIPKQNKDNVNLYVNIDNKGAKSDKIELTAVNIQTGETSRAYFTLDKNENTWQWLVLSRPEKSGKYAVKVEAKSNNYEDMSYAVVDV